MIFQKQSSLSGKTENIDNDIVVFEGIFLTEVTIIFRIPKATCTHVESTISLLQDNHVSSKFQVLVNLLQQFNDHFACIIAPFLGFLWIVISWLECFENLIVNFLFDCWSHFLESYLLWFSVTAISTSCSIAFIFLY